MPDRTVLPKCCPVCGGDSLQPVERHSFGTAESDTNNISGLLGFRCGKGHVFLVTESELAGSSVKAAEQTRITAVMSQRRLRVVKWLSSTPTIGVCTFCGREFKAPMSALTRTADAQANLQGQFEGHKCEREDVKEASGEL
jgi:hypothetical protein